MNIVGEGFSGDIIRQINQRQKIAGSLKRTNEQLLYLNNKTGWVRMVSSVNVTQSGIRNLPYVGDKLAEEFILFNGVTSSTTGARAGVWPGTGPSENYAYGLGGTNFGLKPIPGITQASIKTETRGSLKTATINIIAHNKEQFDIIDVLYMRLGYSILLEWGHSNFFYNNGTYESNNPFSLANSFLSGALTYDNHLEEIQIQRNESNGNYDAIIAKVVNFNWNYTKEGTYNITLTLRSMGDVIESLKSNVLLPGGTASGNDSNFSKPTEKFAQTIKAFADAHEIGREFYRAQQQLANLKPGTTTGVSLLPTTNDDESGYDDGRKSVSYFKQVYQGEGGEQYYIKFSYFLHLLKTKVIPNVNNENVKLLKINNRVKTNIIYYQNRQVSSNPGICNFNITFKKGDEKFIFMPGADQYLLPDSGTEKFKGNFYGQLMNIYFNLNYILTQIDALKDNKGKVSIYGLLNSLCKGWNQATGYVNRLEPIVNAETNEIIILDQTALPNRDAILKKLGLNTTTAFFDVYGLYYTLNNTATSGFIRDLNFSTTISPELATMITIGSTANGYVVGEDATALSRMNNGLEDRFKKTITTPEESTNEAETPTENPLEKDYKNVFVAFNKFLEDLSNGSGKYPNWNQEAITAFTSVQTQLLEYDQAKLTQAEQLQQSSGENKANISSPNSGFLPFNLQITIDGLSGMKVYQKYLIDTTFLPSNYPEALEFLIKGITHTISNNEWTTTLESLAIPKDPFGLQNNTEISKSRNSNTQNITNGNYFRGSVASTVKETTDFLTDVLKGLGIPNPNQNQIQFMKSWRQHEGGKASWNPLNTTLNSPNSQPYNYVSVKNFPDRQTGLNATINTLKNGRYTNVITAIKNIKDENGISAAMRAVNDSPWGSNFNPPVASSWRTLNNLIFKDPIIKRT
jgi:hypothetical protein